MRINRDLNILSRGQILTMNDAQKEFIHTFTLEENIEKDVIISGPVGSGKTIMGLEYEKVTLQTNSNPTSIHLLCWMKFGAGN